MHYMMLDHHSSEIPLPLANPHRPALFESLQNDCVGALLTTRHDNFDNNQLQLEDGLHGGILSMRNREAKRRDNLLRLSKYQSMLMIDSCLLGGLLMNGKHELGMTFGTAR
jgi:hypothetical protein